MIANRRLPVLQMWVYVCMMKPKLFISASADVAKHSVTVMQLWSSWCLPPCWLWNVCCGDIGPSRVCAVAQYAVLDASANVNGRGPFSHPHPSETPQPISMSWVERVDVQNLVGIYSGRYGSAHAWKNTICVDLFINISVCVSVSSSRLQVTVLGRF